MKIKDRLFRRPELFKGQSKFPDSPTIPGQDFTVQEIVRQYTRGIKPLHHYIGDDFSEFQTMSYIDKVDYLKQLSAQNNLAKLRVNEELRKMADQKRQDDLKTQIIAEMRAQSAPPGESQEWVNDSETNESDT